VVIKNLQKMWYNKFQTSRKIDLHFDKEYFFKKNIKISCIIPLILPDENMKEDQILLICPQCNKKKLDLNIFICGECSFEVPNKKGFRTFAPGLGEENQDYDKTFFAELAQVEKGHFWFEARNRLILYLIKKYFSGIENFFEIGCGTGFVLSAIHNKFPNLEITGSDIYIEGLQLAAKRLPQIPLIQMDAGRIPFESYFDLIGSFDVLEHVENDELVLQKINRALRPGGGIIITVPQHMWLWSTLDDQAFHKRRYERKILIEKVKGAGFEICYTTSFVSFLLPLMYLIRFRKKKKETDKMLEFKIGFLTNFILKGVLAIECFFSTQLGFSLPVGGSLVLVAKKI